MSASGPSAPANIHGTAMVLGDRGILITGPSGSGKSTLALELIGRFGSRGRFAQLVADDQLFVKGMAGRLVCQTPAVITGLVEVRGLGPHPIGAETAAVIDLVVRLVPAEELARVQEEAAEVIAGCTLPRIDVPARNVISAAQMLICWLGMPPFQAV